MDAQIVKPQPVILVVDDETPIVKIIVEILSDEGFEVYGANSGAQAIEMLKTIPTPTLLFVDCLMDEMSGAEFIREFKTKFPEISQTVTTIGISGLPHGSSVGAEFASLVQHYEMKPSGLNDWLALVQKYS